MNATARDEVRGSMPTSGGEAASLVESAMLLRWRAPELALLLADRAVAAAGRDQPTVVRAEHLAVVALNRLGRHSEATHRLLPMLQQPDIPVELRHELQVELAHCAAAFGDTATALAALRPVLAAGDDLAPVLRGTALIATAEASVALGRDDIVPNALEEADELFREDPHLDRDTALLLRATAKAVNAARRRRGGAAVECEAQARSGRELLSGLADPEHDSGQISARLTLETVLALLDRGAGDLAAHEARPMLRRPVRAAAAGAVGWLRLAIATRVHLAEGRHEPALGLLADAVEVTQRHGIDAVLAECLEGLSHVHEVRGEFADALHCLRSARAAERRHRRNVETARSALLDYCGVARREVPRLVEQIAGLLPGPGWLRVVPDPVTGLLDAEEYDCRVEGALTGSAAHSQALIAVGSGAADGPPSNGLLLELSTRLRRAAPSGAAFGQITADRIAVLLPGMTRHQAQLWADRFRAATAGKLRVDLSVGVAQYRAGTGADQFLADTVSALRTAAEAARSVPARPEPRKPQVQAAPDPVLSDTVVLEVVRVTPDRALNGAQTAADPPADVEVWPPRQQVPGEIAATAAEPSPPDLTVEPVPGDRAMAPSPLASSPLASPGEDPPAEATSAGETRRRRGNNGTPVLVSDLLPGSVLSAGRSGRRRAEDRAEGPAEHHIEDPVADRAEDHAGDSVHAGDDFLADRPGDSDERGADRAPHDGGAAPHSQTGPMLSLAPLDRTSLSEPTVRDHGVNGSAVAKDAAATRSVSRELPVAGPPPAPTPRALDWSSNGSAPTSAESADVGMGDLLAEALAAFQESGHPLSTDTSSGFPGGNHVDGGPVRGSRGRRTPGVQLATDPVSRSGHTDDALTDPELRLPDLTAEPLWQPGMGRQSAAGD